MVINKQSLSLPRESQIISLLNNFFLWRFQFQKGTWAFETLIMIGRITGDVIRFMWVILHFFLWNEPAQISAFFKNSKSQKSTSIIKFYSTNVELTIVQSYVAKRSTFRVVKTFGGPFASHWKKPMMSRNWWNFLYIILSYVKREKTVN